MCGNMLGATLESSFTGIIWSGERLYVIVDIRKRKKIEIDNYDEKNMDYGIIADDVYGICGERVR